MTDEHDADLGYVSLSAALLDLLDQHGLETFAAAVGDAGRAACERQSATRVRVMATHHALGEWVTVLWLAGGFVLVVALVAIVVMFWPKR